MAANALLHTLNMYGNLKEHCVPVMASSSSDDDAEQKQEEEVIAWEYKRKGMQDVMPEHWIRIPAKADEDTKDLTTRELIWEHIQSVEQNQTISGGGRERADLYRRRWKKKKNNNNDSSSRQQQQEEEEDCTINDEISSSTQVNGLVAAASSPISFTVLQFNTLAQGLSAGLDVEPPFEPSSSSSNKGGGGVDPTKDAYGGFSNLVAPEVALDFQRRKWRLLEVIVGNGKKNNNNNNNDQEQEVSTTTTTTPHQQQQQQQHQHQLLPDIIGLEECDSFHNFFEPMLSVFGYKGIFMPKPNSPGIRYGWYSDGCALFWKTSEWKLLSEHRRPIIAGGSSSSSGNQVAIMAVLQHVVHQKEEEELSTTSSSSSKPFSILVVVTHLKASISNEKTRIEQAKSITEWIQEENKKANHRPVLLLGDFNSPPPTSLKAFAPSCLGTFLNHHKYVKFQSAYDVSKQQQQQRGNSEGSNNNILWTTWKTRGKKTVKRMIDYILYTTTGDDETSSSSSSILTCTETLSVPIQEKEDDPLMPLPSLRYPSDHVAIAAKFELSSKR